MTDFKVVIYFIVCLLSTPHKTFADPLSPPPYSDMRGKRLSSLECATVNLYMEARGESDLANMAIMAVVMQRVEDSRFPNTICEVVFQERQFSWLMDGKSDKIHNLEQYTRLYKLAEKFMLNKELFMQLSEGADHYHTTSISPYWSESDKMDYLYTLDNHKFYKWRK